MTPSPRPAPPRLPWIPGPGVAALGALVAYAAGEWIQWRGQLEVYLVLLTALVLLGVAFTLRRRGGEAIALGFVPAALPLWLATAWAASRSLTFDRMVEGVILRFGFLFLVPALVYAMLAAGRLTGQTIAAHASRRAAIVVRGAAWLATLGAIVLLVASRASSDRPTASAYVASLPVVAQFDEVDRSRYAPPVEAGGGGIVRRILRKGSCWIGEADDVPPSDGLAPAHVYWGLITCGPVVIRADARRGLLVLEDTYHRRVAIDRAHGWQPIRLRPIQLAGLVRPPSSLTALAAIGVAVALLALLRRVRSPLPADESVWRAAEARADGTLRFADDTPPLPHAAPGVLGPVVAVLETPAESFRDHAGPVVARVVPGTLAEHRFAARVGNAAFALAFVVIACTPLATALAYLH